MERKLNFLKGHARVLEFYEKNTEKTEKRGNKVLQYNRVLFSLIKRENLE